MFIVADDYIMILMANNEFYKKMEINIKRPVCSDHRFIN